MLHQNIKILRKVSKEESEAKRLQNQENEKNFSNKKFSENKNSEKIFKEKNFLKNDKKFEKNEKNNFEINSKSEFKKSNKIKIELKNSDKKNFEKNNFSEKKYTFNPENLQFFITCQAWLETLIRKESEKFWLKNTTWQDRLIRWNWDEKTIYSLLINSRFANRIYLEITNQKVQTFDELFEIVEKIEWKKFLPNWIEIVTEATAIKSQLSHTPSIQSITKKAIVKNLTEWTGTHHLYENRNWNEAHIQVFVIENIAYILLDITGNALHKRWYRLETGDAPIKETLAAALVALSGWKFKEKFCDPFCGSGTFAIESAILARNIAPGLYRNFAIQNFPIFNKNLFLEAKNLAESKIFPSGKYQIFARDIDEKMIKIAKDNAIRAWVGNDIIFEVKNFFDEKIEEKTWIVTNPPYWIRLENENDEIFYKNFLKKFANENIVWGFITSYDKIFELTNRKNYKDRKIFNGWLEARFYKKNEQL